MTCPSAALTLVRPLLRQCARPFANSHSSGEQADSVLNKVSSNYLKCRPVKYTHQLSIQTNDAAIPIYRFLPSSEYPEHAESNNNVCKNTARKMFEFMLQLNCIDSILLSAQRQGRITFYHTSYGEEAVMAGAVAGLAEDDVIFAQYREFPVVLYRGVPTQKLMDQMVNNVEDPCKGRQFPCNFGIAAVHFATISAPLSTQMPQAVGAAFALMKHGRTALCFFGDGGSSEGDAHAAFNFAATLRVPVVFLCRNNGYAISTPAVEQYAGDGIAGRAGGYGMAFVRVDGNDALAVQQSVSEARNYALRERRPVLVEAMTYRFGDHSTSDDSRRYRPSAELGVWAADDPIVRLENYLTQNNLTNANEVSVLRSRFSKEAMDCLAIAETKPKHEPETLFDDVYSRMHPRLEAQKRELQHTLLEKP